MVKTGPGTRQYHVRMDGSRNVSVRNKQFLRKFKGVSDFLAADQGIQGVGDSATNSELVQLYKFSRELERYQVLARMFSTMSQEREMFKVQA